MQETKEVLLSGWDAYSQKETHMEVPMECIVCGLVAEIEFERGDWFAFTIGDEDGPESTNVFSICSLCKAAVDKAVAV